MKRVQRWISILLSAAILSTLVACGAGEDKGRKRTKERTSDIVTCGNRYFALF